MASAVADLPVSPLVSRNNAQTKSVSAASNRGMRTFLVLGLLAVKAWGCSCTVSPTGTPPCQSAWLYEAVFTGMVTEITDPVQPKKTASYSQADWHGGVPVGDTVQEQ